jgi:5'-3' exonuclease
MPTVTIEQLLDPTYRVQELTLLIDGDIYAHRAASVTDGRMYQVGKSLFRYDKDVKSYCKKNSIDPAEIETIYQPEPFRHCSGSLKLMLQGIQTALLHKAPVMNMRVFLTDSDKGNFRNSILPHYKWNRLGVDEVIRMCDGDEEMARKILRMKPATFEKNKGVIPRRPEHLDRIKDYLRKKYDAEALALYEADDLIGIASDEYRRKGEEVVIVSIDKDLDCIPGVHYNSVRDEVYIVTPEQALRNFYYQVLLGDTTDNVPGVPGVGEKTATKLLDSIEGNGSELDYYIGTSAVWEKALEGEDVDPLEEMHKSAKCLWILQDSQSKELEAKIWQPPEVTITKEDNEV